MKKFICPQPGVWHDIHQKLEAARKRKDKNISKVPVPLILNGWWYSSNLEKQLRWQESVEWAVANGFSDLIPKLSDEDSHFL